MVEFQNVFDQILGLQLLIFTVEYDFISLPAGLKGRAKAKWLISLGHHFHNGSRVLDPKDLEKTKK